MGRWTFISPIVVVFLCLGSVSGENPQQGQGRQPPRCIADAQARHSIKVKAGDSSADIIASYGRPLSDHILEKYNPQVMREIGYMGLTFKLHSDRLYGIVVGRPFKGEVFGFCIGDPISAAIVVLGKEYGLEKRADEAQYHWDKSLLNWTFVVQKDTIVEFLFHDESIYGKWIPEYRK